LAILKDNNFNIGFWGAKNRFIPGLDPLGMQTASQAAFAHIMPGITNVTNRVRYMGFYCWLFYTYANVVRDTNPARQRNFIRRAELVLALVTKIHQPEEGQVSGSLFAAKMLEVGEEQFDIADAADYENRTVHPIYWKYSWGAFGQYYVGSMTELGLITFSDHENYICTYAEGGWKNSGTELARAFEAQIPEKTRQLFIDSVEEGILKAEATEEISKHFNLSNIQTHSAEWHLYIDLLTGRDHPTHEALESHHPSFFRKSTFVYLLRYLQQASSKEGWQGWVKEVYEQKGAGPGGENKTQLLWYYYQLNELWQFGAGTVFWSLLDELEKKDQLVPLTGFVHSYSQLVVAALSEQLHLPAAASVEELLLLIEGREMELPVQIQQVVKSRESLDAGALGFMLLFLVYLNNEHKIEQLQELAWAEKIERGGSFKDYFSFLEERKEWPLEAFIREFVYQWLIYQHQLVALRKTGSSTTSTLKFIVEEDQVQFLENFPPHFTSPRLGALMNYFKDLSLLDAAGELTAIGKALVEEVEA
jgi:hypothetical protein